MMQSAINCCSVSRCGIIKNRSVADMTVWYTEKVTKKTWNFCPFNNAYIEKVDFANNSVIISAAPNTETDSLRSKCRL